MSDAHRITTISRTSPVYTSGWFGRPEPVGLGLTHSGRGFLLNSFVVGRPTGEYRDAGRRDYDRHLRQAVCPLCGDTEVVGCDSTPSILGYGYDDSERLACGHTVTWDPFTGEPSATRTAVTA